MTVDIVDTGQFVGNNGVYVFDSSTQLIFTFKLESFRKAGTTHEIAFVTFVSFRPLPPIRNIIASVIMDYVDLLPVRFIWQLIFKKHLIIVIKLGKCPFKFREPKLASIDLMQDI